MQFNDFGLKSDAQERFFIWSKLFQGILTPIPLFVDKVYISPGIYVLMG